MKDLYLAELLIVAASEVNEKLSKAKYCSGGYLLRYRYVTLVRFLSTT